MEANHGRKTEGSGANLGHSGKDSPRQREPARTCASLMRYKLAEEDK